MRMSDYFIPTLKENPAEAELVSHRYMLRAGLIRRLSKGIYTWLPLGLRVIRRIEQIVREEIIATGALEILMPMVQPSELWQKTGRWQQYGAELLRFEDRHQHAHCLGPTHEEVVTELARQTLSSYKQLPLTLFQIQTKFRDEIRPRFGVMRAREFIMKDAYSFHQDEASLNVSYNAMQQAYTRILQRLGLDFRVVLADTGSIGGASSHEFHVLADSGEDTVVFSNQSDYAANLEKASSLAPAATQVAAVDVPVRQEVSTPNVRSIDDLCKSLGCDASSTLKAVVVRGSETPWVVLLLRGNDELNVLKAQQLPAVASPLQLADPAALAVDVGCQAGSFGPGLALKDGTVLPVFADHYVAALSDFVCGANRDATHWQHMQWGRDAELPTLVDLRLVQSGDPSPDGNGQLEFKRGIEVGHIFKLQDKYTQELQATVLNEAGKAQSLLSGCYGMGISRLVAAAIEQRHDDAGIIWPETMAPFQVHLIPLMAHKSTAVQQTAERMYAELQAAGIEVLWEDTKQRPGVMLAQADLLGLPHRLVISERNLEQANIEYKARAGKEAETWPLDDYLQRLQQSLS